MTHSQAKSIFLSAVEIASPDERLAFVAAKCGGDGSLLTEVEGLLRHERALGDFLESPALGVSVTDEPPPVLELPGSIIGPYKLLQQIGEGGFGVVYSAEQERPVKRRVALKVIKPGMDTRQVIARFEAERQALAMMDHPNIAKVLDAGMVGPASRAAPDAISHDGPEGPALLAGPTGRPYFVMELVQGVPLTEYCDQCQLTTHQRLELFITVCQAVQHAHQKGIIHRDIKPNNVLVAIQDGKPSPKIIDFGVAKAIDQQLTDHTQMTAFAQVVGTPLYMSPEQAELSPLGVDTRSDIYSLGVLLYELLAGVTPFDKERLHAASYDEMRRVIREEEPPRPSARISTLAANLATTVAERRRSDTRRLQQTVRGELDWIVMKCLEKDRNRRYESASSLVRDIERYLKDEPVVACPPSASYRLTKFARRNKVAVVATAAILASLTIGSGISTWLYFRERAARVDAEVATANETQLRLNDETASAIREALLVLRSQGADAAEQYLASLASVKKEMNSANTASIYNLLGHIRAQQNRLQEAATNFAKAAELEPDRFERYQYYVPLLVHNEDHEGYQRARQELIKHFGRTTNPRYAERALKICLITPWPDADFASLDALAETALQTDPRHWAWPYTQFAIGLLEYRRDNYCSAVKHLQQAVGRMDRFCEVQVSMVLAMAQHKLGDVEQARSSLASGLKYFAPIRSDEAALLFEALWHDWLIARALQDEATLLIADTRPPDPSGNQSLIPESNNTARPSAELLE
jgi:serine/threonine protein kinase